MLVLNFGLTPNDLAHGQHVDFCGAIEYFGKADLVGFVVDI